MPMSKRRFWGILGLGRQSQWAPIAVQSVGRDILWRLDVGNIDAVDLGLVISAEKACGSVRSHTVRSDAKCYMESGGPGLTQGVAPLGVATNSAGHAIWNDSLCHIDGPDAGAGAQVQDSRVFGVVERGLVQLVAAKLEDDGVHHVHADLLRLRG